jgi:hypothetical protein
MIFTSQNDVRTSGGKKLKLRYDVGVATVLLRDSREPVVSPWETTHQEVWRPWRLVRQREGGQLTRPQTTRLPYDGSNGYDNVAATDDGQFLRQERAANSTDHRRFGKPAFRRFETAKLWNGRRSSPDFCCGCYLSAHFSCFINCHSNVWNASVPLCHLLLPISHHEHDGQSRQRLGQAQLVRPHG